MGTNGESENPPSIGFPDITDEFTLTGNELNLQPRFSASVGRIGDILCNNLFLTYVEGGKIILGYSLDGGNDMSLPRVELLSPKGVIRRLEIASRHNTVVVVAIEENEDGLWALGSTATLKIDQNGPFIDHLKCQPRALPTNIDDIVDMTIRINDDKTSDDFIIYRGGAGALTTKVGHHPHAP